MKLHIFHVCTCPVVTAKFEVTGTGVGPSASKFAQKETLLVFVL